MEFEGRVWKFGDHLDTDAIIPARFLNSSDRDELAKSCFADVRPGFAQEVRPGDIIVGGVNFGCGSSREHAAWALKASGIHVIIAKSFARIFYRNAFNIGLPLMESQETAEGVSEGERLKIDLESGEIKAVNRAASFFARPIPEFMRKLIQAGGLINYVKGKKP